MTETEKPLTREDVQAAINLQTTVTAVVDLIVSNVRLGNIDASGMILVAEHVAARVLIAAKNTSHRADIADAFVRRLPLTIAEYEATIAQRNA